MEIDYVDASPRQMVSVATALIPFLENDDANRALMGSNMQRQAVPLITCQPPLSVLVWKKKLVVLKVQLLQHAIVVLLSMYLLIRSLFDLIEGVNDERWFARPVDIYHLKKFGRSSHNTWIHHTPIVKVGQRVEFGEILTDGAATHYGELALGSNVLIAFMPWHGYNFEDAIVCSKRLVLMMFSHLFTLKSFQLKLVTQSLVLKKSQKIFQMLVKKSWKRLMMTVLYMLEVVSSLVISWLVK